MEIIEMYVSQLKSIPQISKEIGVPVSTIRFRLKALGVLRCRSDAVRLAAEQGRLGSQNKGRRRVFSEQWKHNMSISAQARGNNSAKGVSLKPNGYLEITRGESKGRGQHVVIVENRIGRRLFANECVHHRDKNRSNNDPSNLILMTRSEHARLHAEENCSDRERDNDGKFV